MFATIYTIQRREGNNPTPLSYLICSCVTFSLDTTLIFASFFADYHHTYCSVLISQAHHPERALCRGHMYLTYGILWHCFPEKQKSVVCVGPFNVAFLTY